MEVMVEERVCVAWGKRGLSGGRGKDAFYS